MTGPVLVIVTVAPPCAIPVVTTTCPPGTLYRIALSTRFATIRSARHTSPRTAASARRALAHATTAADTDLHAYVMGIIGYTHLHRRRGRDALDVLRAQPSAS
jgi:hypothetical protein